VQDADFGLIIPKSGVLPPPPQAAFCPHDQIPSYGPFNPSVAILEFWHWRLIKLTKYFGKYLKKHCPDG
jgi:hypothetical protein